ncbi:30S ribosomal protein S6 [Buchnera aphidicola]|uniref:Small ribosomal subunit protein bS6 n=1 Tax=Buchnera aphidicola (Cinara cf. splendens/pseudotsugae 3390) TaxID=2518980 RepID=A0A451CXS1_9GAMM|nr:30S ribosomal protein S6 [Buchnera aphidicola]VFP77954.1 30S ribosomal protein S6 [Buchnera aphidicola (Cinara cf. splendens/pseudotsugae 3390)]
MRHYEIILMIYPDKNEKILHVIDFYTKIILSKSGTIHRSENWGQRVLSYSINKLQKANYVLMNIEVSIECMKYLENHFKFNSKIIRNLILVCNKAHTDMSPILRNQENKKKEVISTKNNHKKYFVNNNHI